MNEKINKWLNELHKNCWNTEKITITIIAFNI